MMQGDQGARIVVGAARGISYLHHDCIPHIHYSQIHQVE